MTLWRSVLLGLPGPGVLGGAHGGPIGRRRAAGCVSALVMLGLSLSVGACSSGSGASSKDAAIEGGGGGGTSCQQIRQCVWMYCTTTNVDDACVKNCLALGTASGRELFQNLLSCTDPRCPAHETYCGCEQQCFADATCTAEVEACLGRDTGDLVCDELCR